MYNEFVNAFIDAQTASHRLYREVARAEAVLFGERGTARIVPVPSSGDIERELRVVYESLVTRIIERARSQSAVGSARQVMNRAAICQEAGIDVDRAIAMGTVPDFDRLWNTLDARFPRMGGPSAVDR